jgi:hypothetical protein
MTSPVDCIKLDRAYLCGDLACNTISSNPHRCPVCHSQVMSLANILEGRRTHTHHQPLLVASRRRKESASGSAR